MHFDTVFGVGDVVKTRPGFTPEFAGVTRPSVEACAVTSLRILCDADDLAGGALVLYCVNGEHFSYLESELLPATCACRMTLTADDVTRNSRDYSGALRCHPCYEELCEIAHDNAQAEAHSNV